MRDCQNYQFFIGNLLKYSHIGKVLSVEFVTRDGHQVRILGLSDIVKKSRVCQFSRHLGG